MNGPDKGVFLYQHYDGYNLPATLQKALQRIRDRWNDDAYLARGIFSEMVREDLDSSTGYGITSYVYGTNRPHLVIDPDKMRVGLAPSNDYEIYEKNVYKWWKMDEFIKLDPESVYTTKRGDDDDEE